MSDRPRSCKLTLDDARAIAQVIRKLRTTATLDRSSIAPLAPRDIVVADAIFAVIAGAPLDQIEDMVLRLAETRPSVDDWLIAHRPGFEKLLGILWLAHETQKASVRS